MARNIKNLGITGKIELLKQIISEIYTEETLNKIHENLCKDITYVFLFERQFKTQETGDKKFPQALVTEGKVFEINNYDLIKDFEKEYTGNLEWNKEIKDFENYGTLLFKSLTDEFEENISNEFNEKLGKNAYQIFLGEVANNNEYAEDVNNILSSVIIGIWTRFAVKNFAEVIESYREEVYKEEMADAKLGDSELEQGSTNAFLYQEMVEEIRDEYNIDLMEIEPINKSDKEILSALNEWALKASYSQIEIMDIFLPKKGLEPFQWLNKKTYDNKIEEYQNSTLRVNEFFDGLKSHLFHKKTSYQTDKLYRFLDEIFQIKGEKIISIYGADTTKVYCLDNYNRFLDIKGFTSNQNVIEEYLKLLNDIDYQMSVYGTVVVKNLVGKSVVAKGSEVRSVSSYEIRAAYLIKGIYTGLKKEDAEKFLQISSDMHVNHKLVDWEVGNRNITISISTGNDDNDDEANN